MSREPRQRSMQLRSKKIQITSRNLIYAVYDTASNNEILLSLSGKYYAMDLHVMAPGRQCKLHAPSLPSAAHKLRTKTKILKLN